jgi:hypothetical protein
MNNPGTYNLGDASITTALTGEIITSGVSPAGVAQEYISDLDGMLAATLVCSFAYGSGGTTCAVVVQNTLDGTYWNDVARFDFTTSSSRKVANLSGLLSKAVTAIVTLSSEGVVDGLMASKWRAFVTSTGTYANTQVSVRLAAR